MAWFFMTPIIYPLTQIPERFRNLTYLNPMTGIVGMYRMAIQGVDFSFTIFSLIGIGIIFFSFFIGFIVFNHFEPTFADEL